MSINSPVIPAVNPQEDAVRHVSLCWTFS